MMSWNLEEVHKSQWQLRKNEAGLDTVFGEIEDSVS